MKAIILAAGMGTRLLPYTNIVPKCMVKLKGKPLIEYQLKILHEFSFEKICIVKGYLGHKINYEGITYYINKQYSESNMIWSLLSARSELNGEIIIAYGDIIYSSDILEILIKSKDDIAVVIDKEWMNYWSKRFSNPLSDAESLVLDINGFIKEIGKKPESSENIDGQFIGLLKFSETGTELLFNLLEDYLTNKKELSGKSLKKAYTTDLLQEIINLGHSIKAILTNKPWIEIDSTFDLNLAETENRLNQILTAN